MQMAARDNMQSSCRPSIVYQQGILALHETRRLNLRKGVFWGSEEESGEERQDCPIDQGLRDGGRETCPGYRYRESLYRA